MKFKSCCPCNALQITSHPERRWREFCWKQLRRVGKATPKTGFLINFKMTVLKSAFSLKKDFSSANKFYLLDVGS